jgi:hypothetical protein
VAVVTLTVVGGVEPLVQPARAVETIARANLDGTGADHHLITGLSSPCGVAVDGSHIYWANAGFNTIGRAELDGRQVTQSFIEGANAPCGVAVAGSHVYWANRGGDVAGTSIGRANLDGTGVDQSFITGADAPCGVAVDATHIYWANESGGVGRANLDGTGANQSFLPFGTCGVAVNTAHIYWSHTTLGPRPSGDVSTIWRADLDGTDPAPITSSANATTCGVALDATRVYWDAGLAIARATLDGTQIGSISAEGIACGVAVDTSHVYWANRLGPPLRLAFDGVKRNVKRGTAKLTVSIDRRSGLIAGDVELAQTRRVKAKRKRVAEEQRRVTLPIRAIGSARRQLKRTGTARVEATVTFIPDGARALSTKSKRLRLRRR